MVLTVCLVGDNVHIREIRKEKGLTMKKLGELVGVTESAIGQYETGRRKPDYEMLLRISEALDSSVDELLNGKKIPVTKSDGQKLDIIDLSQLTDDQRKLIEDVLRLNDQQRSAVLSVTESFLSGQ